MSAGVPARGVLLARGAWFRAAGLFAALWIPALAGMRWEDVGMTSKIGNGAIIVHFSLVSACPNFGSRPING